MYHIFIIKAQMSEVIYITTKVRIKVVRFSLYVRFDCIISMLAPVAPKQLHPIHKHNHLQPRTDLKPCADKACFMYDTSVCTVFIEVLYLLTWNQAHITNTFIWVYVVPFWKPFAVTNTQYFTQRALSFTN
jgi:hypothetical protein